MVLTSRLSPGGAAVLRGHLRLYPYGMFVAPIRYTALVIMYLATDPLPS